MANPTPKPIAFVQAFFSGASAPAGTMFVYTASGWCRCLAGTLPQDVYLTPRPVVTRKQPNTTHTVGVILVDGVLTVQM